MSSIFLSCVTDEFGSYRTTLADDLRRPSVEVENQETFLAYGDRTLLMLDDYIQSCDAVIHLAGDQAGNVASAPNREAILGQYSYEILEQQLQLSREVIDSLTYTQWEAWLAVLHQRKLFICTPAEEAPRDSTIEGTAEAETQRQVQQRHLQLLRKNGRYAEVPLKFRSPSRLSIALLRALHEILPPVTIPIAPTLPPSIGRLFMGRDDWLARLRDALRPITEQQNDARRVAVWGFGGLGKTRLAVEYAHTFGHEHSALLVVTANTPEDLRGSLADLAGCLKLAQAASTDVEVRYKAALDWLDDPAHRGWFLLIDNVDNDVAFQQAEALIRRLHYGQVVVTGRIREWPQYVTELHLDVLDSASSTNFLLEATAGKRISDPSSDELQAAELAQRLDGLALALVQAAGAIRRRSLSFADYLSEWDTNHEEVLDDLDFNPTITGYPRTVATTWLTSYDQLTDASKVVFDALCWLAPDPIPERLITQSWPAAALDSVPDETRQVIETSTRRLLQPLYDFCLAEAPQDAQRCFSVHRLIQDVGRIQQAKTGTAAARLLVISSLAEADFVREGIENETLHILAQLHQVAPHVLALLAEQQRVPLIRKCELHRVLSEMRFQEGLNSEAKHHGQQAVSCGECARDSAADDDVASLSLAHALCNFIFVLTARGQSDDALDRGLQALKLTSDWEDNGSLKQREARAWALEEVGRVRQNKGEQDEALKLFEESRRIRAYLCAHEPDNLAHQRELGIVLESVGRVREKKGEQDSALELFKESRQISAELCASEPDNLAHQRELGMVLESVGRVREKKGEQDAALELFERARKTFADLCAHEPDNLALQRDLGAALNNVGRVREKKGEQDAALELFERARKTFADLCAHEPDNLALQRELGAALESVGRVRENKGEQDAALELFEKARKTFADLCAGEPDNLAHQRDLGILLESVGRVRENKGDQDEALKLFEESRQISAELCQREPDNLAHQRDLGIVLESVGRVREKKGEQDAALELFERARKSFAYLCAREQDNLAHQREFGIALFYCGNAYQSLGKRKQAVSRFQQAAAIFRNLKKSAAFGDTQQNLQKVEFELLLLKKK